jgi:cell division protein FtsL
MLRSSNALNVLLLVAVVMCALSVVTSQHKARKLYIELQKEKEQAQQMEVEWGQLQLELSTWATPARVEKVAVRQLGMHLPGSGQVQFIKLNKPLPPIVMLPSSAKAESVATGPADTSVNGEKPQR